MVVGWAVVAACRAAMRASGAGASLVTWAHANWARVIVHVRRMQLQGASGDCACMGANLRALRGPVVPMRMVRAALGRVVFECAAVAADLRRLVGNVVPSCALWCQSCSTIPSGPTTGSC